MLRIFLIISVFIWLPYGLFCFFLPEFASLFNGVEPANETGLIEFRAIYGGLQSGMGLMTLYALYNSRLERPVLFMFIFLCGGMGLGRFMASDFSADVSFYTYMALILELATAAIALWVLSDAQDK